MGTKLVKLLYIQQIQNCSELVLIGICTGMNLTGEQATKTGKYAEDSEQKKAEQLPDSCRKDKVSKAKSQKWAE